jgi:hypothetical protein
MVGGVCMAVWPVSRKSMTVVAFGSRAVSAGRFHFASSGVPAGWSGQRRAPGAQAVIGVGRGSRECAARSGREDRDPTALRGL